MKYPVSTSSRAGRRAAPKPAQLPLCLPVDPASITAATGDRARYSLHEGLV